MNKMRNKVFTCPKCKNKSLYPVNTNGIDYHDIFICGECAAELWSEPQFDGTVKFVVIKEEE